jgi:hypothetical protein
MRCYKCCKYFSEELGYWCNKFNTKIIVSHNIAHYGLLIHPRDSIDWFEDWTNEQLIDFCKKCQCSEITEKIITYYTKYQRLSEKQRKYLIYNIMDCYEGN